MTAVRVYLGGEGRNELGDWYPVPHERSAEHHGVVERLLVRVRPEGWSAIGAMPWKNIRKLRGRGPTPNEQQNVLGLVLEAKRAAAQVLAFVRDADDDAERPKAIAAALEEAAKEFPEVKVIGAAAVPALEGWMLALLEQTGTERLGKAAAQSKLSKRRIPAKSTAAMVKLVDECDLARVPADALGLHGWISRATTVLSKAT